MIGKAFLILILVNQVLGQECGSPSTFCSGKLPDEIPWLSYIWTRTGKLGSEYEDYQSCGGMIIDEYNILTAASCVDKKERIGVYAGPGQRGQTLKIKALKIHKDYKYNQNNIAMIHLKDPIKFGEKVKSICLPEESESLQGKEFLLSGNDARAERLAISKVKSIEKKNPLCERAIQRLERPITYKEVCVKNEGIGKCTREKGTGLIAQSKDTGKCTLYGLLSPLADCETGKASVVLDIPKYLKWIKKNTFDKKNN